MLGMPILSTIFQKVYKIYSVTLSLGVILKILPTKLWMSQSQC